MKKIEKVEQLREYYAQPSEKTEAKSLDRLDKHSRRYLEYSPFFVISSMNTQGHADVSPRGETAGFVQVLDDNTLLIPDRPGNNRLDTLSNVVENPSVGLLFFIPGIQDTLRVNGKAYVTMDDDLRERFVVDGKAALSVLWVDVEEVFFHCPKAIMRSKLWEEESRRERSILPPMRKIISDQLNVSPPKDSDEEMRVKFEKALY